MNPAKRLVVLLANGSRDAPAPVEHALRYAMTAAALDLSVELHVVGASVALLRRPLPSAEPSAEPTAADRVHADLQARMREFGAQGGQLYACSAALAEAGLTPADLIDAVSGVRGAAALLAAGMAADARLLSF